MSVWPISRQAAAERGNNTGISVGTPLQGGKEGGCIHARRRLVERHLAVFKQLAPKRGQWHPHACGAGWQVSGCQGVPAGSSPRVCGADARTSPATRGGATVHPRVWGRQWSRCSSGRCQPIHPHACGADEGHGAALRFPSGSSPRVWGRRIPRPTRERWWPVHPHACGADQPTSPTEDDAGRFIPTRVGQTRIGNPRVCPGRGSSPRVWGRPPPRTPRTTAPAVHPHACGADGPYG